MIGPDTTVYPVHATPIPTRDGGHDNQEPRPENRGPRRTWLDICRHNLGGNPVGQRGKHRAGIARSPWWPGFWLLPVDKSLVTAVRPLRSRLNHHLPRLSRGTWPTRSNNRRSPAVAGRSTRCSGAASGIQSQRGAGWGLEVV